MYERSEGSLCRTAAEPLGNIAARLNLIMVISGTRCNYLIHFACNFDVTDRCLSMPTYTESPSHRRHRGTKTEKEQTSGGRLSRIAAAMTSVAGIATAIATIMTSVTAALGVAVHHQATQLQQAQQQVSQQAHQIQVLQSSRATQRTATPAATPAPSATGSPAPASGLGGVAHYLSNLTPTVDNQSVQNGQKVIAAVPYPSSIAFYCNGSDNGQPDEAYDVAGSTVFTAEVGLADNTDNVTGVIATVVFSNEAGQELGKPVQVSLGHPRKVTLNISGITQLGMACSGRDTQTDQAAYSFAVALGDAGIS